jgi:hypothetical protein
MKNVKSSATWIGVALLLVSVALLVISYSMGSTIVEKPVYVREYVETPVYVQPSWWGFYGTPWGHKSGYDKPWKIGSGLPGMKVPPPPPPPAPSPPPGPAPTGPTQPPAPSPPPAASQPTA